MQLLCNNCLLFLFLVSAKARLFISNESDRMHRQEHLMRRAQDKEAIFSDVLKNITRVNDVLEDLIQNYERLQNMYNTQETIESSLSSDSEIDEEFKHRNQKFRQNSENTTTTPRKYQTTEMILSEEFSEDYVTKKIKPNYEVKREPKIQHSKQKDSEHGENNQSEEDSSHDENNESLVKSTKNKDKQSIKEKQDQSYYLKPKKNINNKIASKTVAVKTAKKEPKEIVTQKSTSEEIETTDESNETVEKGIQIKNPVKTRFNVKQYSSKDEGEGGMSIEEPISSKSIVQRVVDTTEAPKHIMKKIIQTESFTEKNIWEDIINMKPVNLKIEKEITYNNRKGLAYHLAKLFQPRAAEDKKPLLPIYMNKRDSEKHIMRSKNNDSFEDEKIFNKEMFKTKVLRKAYGDACLKVVIRKCYKACTKALKTTCKSYACKHGMKPTFKERARRYCLREFDDTPKETRLPQNIPINNIPSGILDGAPVVIYERDKMKIPVVPMKAANKEMRAQVPPVDNGFLDITRNGYLAPACLSDTKPVLRSGNETVGIVEGKLNILRDRFERECKRSSAEKCINACNDAVRDACDTASCKGGKKRSFEKNCKKECKASYSYKSGSDSDGTSSSDSSGSSSGSSSDSRRSKSRKSREHKKPDYNNLTTLPSLIKRELQNIREEKKIKEAAKNQKESTNQQKGTIQQEPIKQQRSLNYRSGISFKIDTEPRLSSARTTKPLAYKPILRHIFYRRDD